MKNAKHDAVLDVIFFVCCQLS